MKEKLRSDFLDRQKMVQQNFELYYYNDSTQIHVNPHQHENYEVQFFLEGDAVCFINDQKHTLRPQDVVIIPPKSRHFNKVSDKKPYRRFIFWFTRDFAKQLIAEDEAYGYFAQEAEKNRYIWHFTSVGFNSILARLVSLLESMQVTSFGHEALVELAVRGLVLKLNQGLYEIDHPFVYRDDKSLNEMVLDYIQAHLHEDLSLEKIAGVFYVSKYHISHLFKSEMGISLHQFVIKKRLEQVRTAILANEDLSRAIEAAGFGNYSSFFRAFQKEFGMSPTEYRKKRSLESLEQNDTPTTKAMEE